MTMRECYERMGADYDGTLRRFGNEERIKRFLLMFLTESSYGTLCDALRAGTGEEAFRAAHSLKGVSANLGLTALNASSAALTDALRGGSISTAAGELLLSMERDYQNAVEAIGELLA